MLNSAWAKLVSTHSRPKAAGSIRRCRPAQRCRFNSQPPEGGWQLGDAVAWCNDDVSTHSRPKAAGHGVYCLVQTLRQFQLTAARRRLGGRVVACACVVFSFNSQPPEGGWDDSLFRRTLSNKFQLTAARRRLDDPSHGLADVFTFQLTAARRRLVALYTVLNYSQHGFNSQPPEGGWAMSPPIRYWPIVSTHSRPKAAGASAETLNRQGLHCPVSLRFH